MTEMQVLEIQELRRLENARLKVPVYVYVCVPRKYRLRIPSPKSSTLNPDPLRRIARCGVMYANVDVCMQHVDVCMQMHTYMQDCVKHTQIHTHTFPHTFPHTQAHAHLTATHFQRASNN